MFQEEYAERIAGAKDKLIKADLRIFHFLLQNLETYEAPLFYATDGTNVFTNTTKTEKGQFETYPAYMIFEGYKQKIYPEETKNNRSFYH